MTDAIVPSGFLFKKMTFLILGIIVFWAAKTGLTVIVMLCGLLMASSLLTRLWAIVCLKNVYFKRSLDKTKGFPKETIQARFEISNRKLIPLFWVSVEEKIHKALSNDPSFLPSKQKGVSISASTVALPGYSKAHWQHTLTCGKRGWYPLGSITLTSGDMFGFYISLKTVSSTDEVIVFPALYKISTDRLPHHSPLGETKADHTLYQDPSRVVGLRDYTPFDSLRHVHWKASARRNQLQVKVFESTVQVKTAIFLSVDQFTTTPGSSQLFEDALSTAASISVKLIERQSHVGFYANAIQSGTGHPMELSPKNCHAHLMHVLESMARCRFRAHGSFIDLIVEKLASLPWGCTLMFILNQPPDELRQKIDELKSFGHRIMILDMGDPLSEKTPWLISDYYRTKIEHDTGLLHMKPIGL